ncbi:sulfite exporter TauE/SafE family protein [Allorhizocola rhizosphaerae]|uniref:sulfite exporter TauE/SafE family protein n=1 Tax=Allorhizocola rhizosphaerae TaxID=1872709 RepID=UPI000E3C44A4|nr:sulfite exporter TauE/SafE family protein [Allorhizocola rhizosphaerae]
MKRHTLVGIGVLAGVMSALFGVGGGAVVVPALVAWCGRDHRQAVATSFLAIGPLSLAAMVGYAVHGQVDVLVAAPLIAGLMAGAWIGTHLLTRLSQGVLRWIFALFALAVAVRMAFGTTIAQGEAVHGWRLLWLVPAAVAIGVLAALTGVGGGAAMVPLMQLGYGLSAVLAKGTSLLAILPTSALGSWRNLRNGLGSMSEALWIGCSGMLAALATSQLSVRLPQTVADRLFAAFLVFVAVRTVWGSVKASAPAR